MLKAMPIEALLYRPLIIIPYPEISSGEPNDTEQKMCIPWLELFATLTISWQPSSAEGNH